MPPVVFLCAINGQGLRFDVLEFFDVHLSVYSLDGGSASRGGCCSGSGVSCLLAFGKGRNHGAGKGGVFLDEAFLSVTGFSIPDTTEASEGTVFGSKLGANGD